jgi:hypothetical protein
MPNSLPLCSDSQWRFFPSAKALGDDYKVVSTLHQGQHFGEYGCLLGQPRSATIVALEFCELYSLTRDDLMECYQQWPKLHKEFLHLCENPRYGLTNAPADMQPNSIHCVSAALRVALHPLRGLALLYPAHSVIPWLANL